MPGNQHQNPHAAHDVARVLGQPQEAEQVFDVGRLDELEPAVLVERDVAAGKLDFERHAVVRRPEQHRLLAQLRPPLAMLQDTVDDELRLLVFVGAVDQLRAFARLAGARQRSLPCRSFHSAMTRLVASRIGCVLR